MRAALYLVAGLFLTACSSPITSLGANAQPRNATGRLAPAEEVAHLTLVFKNAENYSYLYMDALPQSCIVSVAPDTMSINYKKSRKVDIVAKISDECAHKKAELDFATTLIQVSQDEKWKGALDIWHDPEKNEWTAKTRGNPGRPDLCTEPPGFDDGVRLHENEQIDFSLC